MAELREIALPENFFTIPELKELDRVSEKFISEWYDEIEDLHDDLLITTATERGIARREKILGITPLDGDDLETRRARVLFKWYEKTPYTRRVVERKIAVLCGEDNYEMNYDPVDMILYVKLGGVSWDVTETVIEALEEMIMLNIILDVKRVIWSEVETPVYASMTLSKNVDRAPKIIEEV